MPVTSGSDSPLFTIVCVSHRPEVLNSWLLPSVQSQRASYEFRVVDPRVTGHTSCAAALNAGAAQARGRYLMFVHHDVAWDSPGFLSDLAAQLDQLPRLGIAGVVGSSRRRTFPYRTYENGVLEGNPPGRLSGTPIRTPCPTQTVDELLLIVPADVFSSCPFDAITCDDWHLYGVDYALSVRQRGLSAWVLPFIVRHKSSGDVNSGYYRTLAKVCKKHRAVFPRICTTVGAWETRLPPALHPAMAALAGAVQFGIAAIAKTIVRTPDHLLPSPVRRWKHSTVSFREPLHTDAGLSDGSTVNPEPSHDTRLTQGDSSAPSSV